MPCLWQILATVRPMPDAEPGMRAGDEGCVACFEDGVEWYDWWAGMLIGREVERFAEGSIALGVSGDVKSAFSYIVILDMFDRPRKRG